MQQNVLNIAMPKNLALRNIYRFMKCIFENQNDRCVLLLSIRCLCKWLTLNMPSLACLEYNGSTTTWSDVNKFDDTMTFFSIEKNLELCVEVTNNASHSRIKCMHTHNVVLFKMEWALQNENVEWSDSSNW